MQVGLTIDQMKLSPNAKQAAELVLAAHPSVVFTSGRRDARAQARAMAENTIRYGTNWMRQTYKNLGMVRELERWMEDNLEKTTSKKHMAEGFYRTLLVSPFGEFAQFPHCRGDAFDIQCPRDEQGQIDEDATLRITETIEQLPAALGLQLVVSREGGLRIIHAQFTHQDMPAQV